MNKTVERRQKEVLEDVRRRIKELLFMLDNPLLEDNDIYVIYDDLQSLERYIDENI